MGKRRFKFGRFKFGLKTLLIATALIAVSVTYWQRGRMQRRNVQVLMNYEYYFPDTYGDQFLEELRSNSTYIEVVYRDEVTWHETEQRFVRDLPNQDSHFYNWIREYVGRDFVTSPVAIVISCNDFDRENGGTFVSTFDESLLDNINRLPTLQQLWGIQNMMDGENVNAFSNCELKEHFPDFIFAPTSIWDSRKKTADAAD